MISVKDALELALSETLTKEEKIVYDNIHRYIDNLIRNNFNGKSLSFKIEGSYNITNGGAFNMSEHITKSWRRDIVQAKWKKDYSDGGWRLQEKEVSDYSGRKNIEYTLSVDPSYKRDEKLNMLLS